MALYAVRRNNRGVYACVELIAGVIVTWAAVSQIAASMSASFATLAAAAYLLVRGLDNLVEAYREDEQQNGPGDGSMSPARPESSR